MLRAFSLLGILVVAACNPDKTPATPSQSLTPTDQQGTSTGVGLPTTGVALTGTTTPTTDSTVEDTWTGICPPPSQLVAPATCPPACTGGCNGTTCIVDCTGQSECQGGALINCPDQMDCLVECHGLSSCQGATVNGPPRGNVDVECDGVSACQGMNMTCTSGDSCELWCNNTSTCQGGHLTCGLGECHASCTGLSANLDSADCGKACICGSNC